jgi:hypothetical protein
MAFEQIFFYISRLMHFVDKTKEKIYYIHIFTPLHTKDLLMFQQVTLSIILLSTLVHNTTAAMENTSENPISETTEFHTPSWRRRSSGTLHYSYPNPDNAKNQPYQGTPAAFEVEYRHRLFLNIKSLSKCGKSNSFLERYEAKQLRCLGQHKQVIIQQQQKI